MSRPCCPPEPRTLTHMSRCSRGPAARAQPSSTGSSAGPAPMALPARENGAPAVAAAAAAPSAPQAAPASAPKSFKAAAQPRHERGGPGPAPCPPRRQSRARPAEGSGESLAVLGARSSPCCAPACEGASAPRPRWEELAGGHKQRVLFSVSVRRDVQPPAPAALPLLSLRRRDGKR